MMKEMVLGLFMATIAGGSAIAEDTVFNGFYSGTEAVGTFSTSDTGEGSGQKTVGGFLGASWSNGALYGAVEAEVAIGLGFEEDLSEAYEPHRTASISAIAGVQATDNLIVFGRVGVQAAQVRARRGDDVQSRKASGLRLGIGADYAIAPGIRLRAEVGRSYLSGVNIEEMESTEIRLGLINQF